MATQTKSIEKWKNKMWFNIHSPKILGESVISEIPAASEKSVVGRIIKVTLSWITQNPNHSFMTVGLKVIDVNGNAAHTELNYLEEVYSYTHSLVRRGSSVIYTIDKVKDSAGKEFILKLIIVTRNKITTPKKSGIRLAISKFAKDYVAATSSEDFLKSVIDGKFQSDGTNTISNIAQISKFDVKKIEF